MKIISKELKFEGNEYNIIEALMKYKNDHLKIFKQEYEKKLRIKEK